MIPVPSGMRVWLSVGRTDMRRGMNGLHFRCRRHSGETPLPAISLCFVGGVAT